MLTLYDFANKSEKVNGMQLNTFDHIQMSDFDL